MARAIILNLRDGGHKSRGLMESRLIARGLASSLWLGGGRTGTLALKPLIMGYIGFVPFDCLIHLLWSQFATIFGYFRVQNVSYFFMDSVHGNLILEGLKLFVRQFILPIFTQVAQGGAYPYQNVYGSLLRLLAKILYGVPLLLEGEGPTIVFPQHLEESS